MSGNFTRRQILTYTGAAGLLPLVSGCATSAAGAKVVVVGGGFGGASTARALKRLDPTISVTLVERSETYVTCPFSNAVIAGLKDISFITHSYEGVKKAGINVVHDEVTGIDAGKREVKLKGGAALSYDRLVVAPGIDFKWNGIEGYDQAAAEIVPHAWKAGAQTLLLRRQLEALPDGGLVILAAPGNPYRCPPGPYERASLIAHYLKTKKPRSKLIILDAKDAFSKQGLFQDAWAKLYKGIVEWVPASKDGKVVAVDAKQRTAVTEFKTRFKADVLNVIPPQQAGLIAGIAGLTDKSGWVPVKPQTFESAQVPGVYVVGDATIATPMPKSGFIATAHGKAVAAAVIADLTGRTPSDPFWINTCYSQIAPDYAISVAGVYRNTEKGLAEVPNSGGVSPKDADAGFRALENQYAEAWYKAITSDTFA